MDESKEIFENPNDPDLKAFSKYLYGFVNDLRLEFNLANDRYATRILIESIILIATELKGIKKALEKNNG
tara:strand:- start:983 stop:1192 length:210 start_codon:yes stop_codon:yes gene_type:complete